MENFDFSGWATRNDLLCGDGRTIRKNAFKGNDGQTVPMIWNHDHSNPDAVLGHALLENRDDGVYAYGKFNDTAAGQNAKKLVMNGDVRALSIYANQLQQIGKDVVHGCIRELSLVLAGANPGAFIDFAMAHGEDGEETITAGWDENALVIYHSEDKSEKKEEPKEDAKEEPKSDKTIGEVIDSMTEEQKTAMYAVIAAAIEDDEDENESENTEGGNDTVKHNVFDQEDVKQGTVLSHSDQESILKNAKNSGVGTLQNAIKDFASKNETLAHGIDNI